MVIFDTAESTLINAISKIADLFFALLGIFVDFFFFLQEQEAVFRKQRPTGIDL